MLLPFCGGPTEGADLNDEPGFVMLSGGLYEDLGFSNPSGPRRRVFLIYSYISSARDSSPTVVVDLRGGTQI